MVTLEDLGFNRSHRRLLEVDEKEKDLAQVTPDVSKMNQLEKSTIVNEASNELVHFTFDATATGGNVATQDITFSKNRLSGIIHFINIINVYSTTGAATDYTETISGSWTTDPDLIGVSSGKSLVYTRSGGLFLVVDYPAVVSEVADANHSATVDMSGFGTNKLTLTRTAGSNGAPAIEGYFMILKNIQSN
jgi:hypothetical protein